MEDDRIGSGLPLFCPTDNMIVVVGQTEGIIVNDLWLASFAGKDYIIGEPSIVAMCWWVNSEKIIMDLSIKLRTEASRLDSLT